MGKAPRNLSVPHRLPSVRIFRSRREKQVTQDPAERFQQFLVQLLVEDLQIQKESMTVMDLATSNPNATLRMHALLPTGSRVIAVSDVRSDLHALHDRVGPLKRREIFPRKERLERLPFSDSVFDAAWAILPGRPLDPLRRTIRQALRVLRPGGQLLVATPLRSTIVELANTIGPALEEHTDDDRFATLLASPPVLLGAHAWQETLERCGAVDVKLRREKLQLEFAPPFSAEPLFASHLLPLWLGDDHEILRHALESLDRHTNDVITLNVHVAGIQGRRSRVPFENSVSG